MKSKVTMWICLIYINLIVVVVFVGDDDPNESKVGQITFRFKKGGEEGDELMRKQFQ